MDTILHDEQWIHSLIPNPYRSHEACERLAHRDLAGMSDEAIWAEATLLTTELASAIYEKRRPQLIYTTGLDDGVTDIAWMRDRLIRLRAETRARGTRR